MKTIVAFVAILACAAAAPGLLVAHETPVVHAVHAPVVHAVPVVGTKTTITKSSQVVNHGSPVVAHAVPLAHTVAVAPVVHTVHTPVVVKTAPVAVAHSQSVVHHRTPIVKTLVALH